MELTGPAIGRRMGSILRDKRQSDKGIELSGSVCVLCGWAKKDPFGNLLLHGAHVRGLENVKDYDRFDNIIALCPNHHVEFDRGNLCIDFDAQVCWHINKSDEMHGKKLIGKIVHVQRGYFEYHRVHVFKGAQKTTRL
jgi:predicted restriction endonuclease